MKWSEVDWSLQDAAGDGPEGCKISWPAKNGGIRLINGSRKTQSKLELKVNRYRIMNNNINRQQ